MDFPGLHRVDHLNGSDISRVLKFVADHYEEELDRQGNKDFLQYIVSMWTVPNLVRNLILKNFVLVVRTLYSALG